MAGNTPYIRFGNLPIGLLSLALLALGLVQALRGSRKS
jgi:apolipoprotein N-acyltransferase